MFEKSKNNVILEIVTFTNIRSEEGQGITMKSIQTKFIVMIAAGLLSMALIVGGYSVWNTTRIIDDDSVTMINAVCTEKAYELNDQLQEIEYAVTTIYTVAQERLESAKSLKDSQYADQYVDKMEDLAVKFSNQTEGALAVYFHLDPKMTGTGDAGFYLQMDKETGKFTHHEVTNLYDYEKDDAEYVGWYYLPVEAGKPIWMDPYYNKVQEAELISYVIPFYQNDTLVGVLGMDVDFALFVDQAQSAALYEHGRANLINMNTREIYYRMNEDTDIETSVISDHFYNDLFNSQSTKGSLKDYVVRDTDYQMAVQTLRNGMKYILYAPEMEIDSYRNRQVIGIIMMTIGVLMVFLLLTSYMTRRIIYPLKELTVAAERLAEGEWDVEIACDTQDELSILTYSIQQMAIRLKDYFVEINGLAYKDALTGVKNKARYLDYIEELSASVRQTEQEYAVVVFDVNGLKPINDTYGHELGDRLILSASQYICHCYSHSPVFRIGGDEFVAILMGDDYAERENLSRRFEEKMQEIQVEAEKSIALSIAHGMAEYPKDGTQYEEIFRKADEQMYLDKKRMKENGA